MVGSQGGCQEPKLGPACEQDLQGHRHGILLPNHQTDRKVGLGSFPRSAGICLPDRSGSEPAEETARPHPPPVPFRRVPPSSPSRDSGGPSLVGLAGESEQMVPIWTVGAFLSSLARCVRDWLGGHDQKGAWAAGSWKPYESTLHMNLLKLKAILHTLASNMLPQGSSIRVFSDNSTTVQALLKQGSSRTLSVTKELQDILSLCKRKSLSIFPHKIPGKLSVLADALSRDAPLPGEGECEAVNSTQRTEPGPWQLSQVCRWT